ncbi:HNH endonuclease signature motif containing protein [Lacrimispora brassicae]
MCVLEIERSNGQPIEWEQVKGFSKYLVSDTGLVFSLERDKILSQYDNGCGYLQIVIRNDDGATKSMRVHRLVYMAHKGEIPKGLEINHKDKCKTNNCIENLEVVTRAQNNNYGSHNARISESMKKYRAKQRKAMAC